MFAKAVFDFKVRKIITWYLDTFFETFLSIFFFFCFFFFYNVAVVIRLSSIG